MKNSMHIFHYSPLWIVKVACNHVIGFWISWHSIIWRS